MAVNMVDGERKPGRLSRIASHLPFRGRDEERHAKIVPIRSCARAAQRDRDYTDGPGFSERAGSGRYGLQGEGRQSGSLDAHDTRGTDSYGLSGGGSDGRGSSAP